MPRFKPASMSACWSATGHLSTGSPSSFIASKRKPSTSLRNTSSRSCCSSAGADSSPSAPARHALSARVTKASRSRSSMCNRQLPSTTIAEPGSSGSALNAAAGSSALGDEAQPAMNNRTATMQGNTRPCACDAPAQPVGNAVFMRPLARCAHRAARAAAPS